MLLKLARKTWSSAASSRRDSSTRLRKAFGLCPTAPHRPGCKREKSDLVERSQLYQRLFASSSRRTKRRGILGVTARLNTVPEDIRNSP